MKPVRGHELTSSRRRPTFQPPLVPIYQCSLVSSSWPTSTELTTSATPVYTQELGIPCGSYVRGRKSPPIPPAHPNTVPAFPFPSPPNTPGSYVTSKSDPSTLIQIGSLHSQVLASNMRSMMPVLMAYGYSRDDLEMLVEDCVSLVCLLRWDLG
jgi:hypothetical protein